MVPALTIKSRSFDAVPVLKPLDLSEWAQGLLTGPDRMASDMAREILDLIDLEPVAERYTELVERLEKIADKKFYTNPEDEAWRWAEYVEAGFAELDEFKEAKESDRVALLDRAEKICKAEMTVEQEYDL